MPKQSAQIVTFHGKTQDWDLSKLTLYEHNNKKHPPEKVERLAQLIQAYGLDQLPVITPDGELIKGHARYAALRSLGVTRCPCIVRDDLTAEQVKAARIADNAAADGSEYDFEAIALDLSILDAAGFDLELTGLEDPMEILNAFNEDIEPEKPKHSLDGMGKKNKGAAKVQPVLLVDQVGTLEQALRLTGESNRQTAFMVICQSYIDSMESAI